MVQSADHEAAGRRVLVAAARVEQQFAIERPAEADAVLGRDATLQVGALTGSNGT